MEIIEELYTIIMDRKNHRQEGSYVSSLFEAGEGRILAKVEEEAEEVLEAARTETNPELIHETADLLFHLLVLIASRGITPEDIQKELTSRRK